jgi:hypothetical protein
MAYPMMRAATLERRRRVVRAADVAVAAAVAGIVSGAPSTLHAVVTGRSALDAVRAAASLAPTSARQSAGAEVVTGLAVHMGLSVVWAAVLAGVVPRRHPVLWGAVAGAGIAALDLGVVGRRHPAITELPLTGQVADHVVFGAAVGWVLTRRAPPTG